MNEATELADATASRDPAVGLAAVGKGLDGGIAVAIVLIALYPPVLLALGFTNPGERRRLWALVGR